MIIVLLEFGQLKHLKDDGNGRFKYIDNGNVTEKEKQSLRDLDADYFEVYQYHIITNLNEIK